MFIRVFFGIIVTYRPLLLTLTEVGTHHNCAQVSALADYQRTNIKDSLLAETAPTGLGSNYSSDLALRYEASRALRSSAGCLLRSNKQTRRSSFYLPLTRGTDRTHEGRRRAQSFSYPTEKHHRSLFNRNAEALISRSEPNPSTWSPLR